MGECATDIIVGHFHANMSRKRDSGTEKAIYVIGPVTGIAEDNRPAFEAARKRLHEAGYVPVGIPHDSIEPGTPWEQAMRMSLCNMHTYFERPNVDCSDLEFDCFEYDGIALLDGWYGSNGARIERSVAKAVGMPCRTVDEWVRLARADAHSEEGDR